VHAGGRWWDRLGGLVARRVEVAQPDPAVAVVVAQAVEVEVGERDVGGGEVEVEVDGDRHGLSERNAAAGEGPLGWVIRSAMSSPVRSAKRSVLGTVAAGVGIVVQVAERSVPRFLR
jgi:hypothetical protein